MACASGSETNLGLTSGSGGAGSTTTVGTTTSSGPATTSVTTTAATTTTTAAGGGQCVPSCSADSDCQGSCPAQPAGASNCCDTQTNICYVSNTSQCPAPNPTTGSGAGGSMY